MRTSPAFGACVLCRLFTRAPRIRAGSRALPGRLGPAGHHAQVVGPDVAAGHDAGFLRPQYAHSSTAQLLSLRIRFELHLRFNALVEQ